MKPWNTKMTVCIDEDMRVSFRDWYKNFGFSGRASTVKMKETPCPKKVLDYIQSLYNLEGYGLKSISSSLGISYTKLRTLFSVYGIEIHRGQNIVTDRVRKFRSERVIGGKNPWADWECRENIHSNGIQGEYITKNGERVWLRSCWEYIFCKWLDKNNITYKVEYKQYTLSDGTSYRPDFFIFDDSGNIKYVVEVKGYNKEKKYKTHLLQNEYGIQVVVVEDINHYCESYEKELKTWKTSLKK